MEYSIECYNYHNFGYIARFFRNIFVSNSIQDRIFQSMRKYRKIEEKSMQETKKEEVQEPKSKVKQVWKEKEQSKNNEELLIVQIDFKV